jgi:hypothetical protein
VTATTASGLPAYNTLLAAADRIKRHRRGREQAALLYACQAGRRLLNGDTVNALGSLLRFGAEDIARWSLTIESALRRQAAEHRRPRKATGRSRTVSNRALARSGKPEDIAELRRRAASGSKSAAKRLA